MPAAIGFVRATRKPWAELPQSLRAPVLGLSLVLLNTLLVALGARYHRPVTCNILAGSVDGAVVAVVIVAAMGERLRAGVTGLMSGYGIANVSDGFDSARKSLNTLHGLADSFLSVMPVSPDEPLHDAIQDATLWITWTTVFVVLAALLMQWILIDRQLPDPSS